MGVLRCDHFLPTKACFVNHRKKTDKNQQILLSEKILVQPETDQKNNEIHPSIATQKTKYTYFYSPHDSIQNLKNIIISPIEKAGTRKKKKIVNLLIFDYLRNDKVAINRIIAFMELFHYFSKQCELKTRNISFVEGEFALEYLLKKTYGVSNVKISQKKESSFLRVFASEGYLLIENEKMKINSFLDQKKIDELVKLNRKKKSFFCQSK